MARGGLTPFICKLLSGDLPSLVLMLNLVQQWLSDLAGLPNGVKERFMEQDIDVR